MKRNLYMKQLCTLLFSALLVFNAFAKDCVLFSNNGNIMSISLEEECTVKSIKIATEKAVDLSLFQVWDRKPLQARQITPTVMPVKGGFIVNLQKSETTSGIIIKGSKLPLISSVIIIEDKGERNVPVHVENPRAKRITPVPEKDLAVVLNGKVMPLSQEKKERLTLGSPNNQNRRDRAVIRLNLLDFIGMDDIKSAILHLQFSPYRANFPRQVEVECLNEEQRSITIDTGFGFTTRHTASLILPFAPKIGPFKVTLDITDDVNQALQKGIASLTYRLRDCHCDQFGNLAKKPYAIAVDVPGIWFSIE